MQSSSRNGAKPRVLCVHTTEGIMRAADLRAWATWPGSSHASADETGVLLAGAADGFVDYDRAAWTLRNGNPWSENIELCGFAKWKRDDWLARPKLLDACAKWLADRSVARGIPLVKLSPKELAAGRSGVIGHVDYTVGYSDGTHWDPGPDFPYDVVLDRARSYAGGSTPPQQIPTSEEDDMTPEQDRKLAEVHRLLGVLTGYPNVANQNEATAADVPRVVGDNNRMLGVLLGWKLPATAEEAAALAALRGGDGPDADPQAFAALLRPMLTEAVRAGMDAHEDATAAEIADELAARLAS